MFIFTMKAFLYRGVQVELLSFLTSELDGNAWLSSHPTPVLTEWDGRWAPRAGLGALRREKYLAPAKFRSPARPARSVVTIPTELPRLLLFLERLRKVWCQLHACSLAGNIHSYTHRTVHCETVGKPQRLAVPLAKFPIRIFRSCVFPEYFTVTFRNGKCHFRAPCMISR